MCSLHDSLVDALVAVGVNSSSGLVPSQIDVGSQNNFMNISSNPLFELWMVN